MKPTSWLVLLLLVGACDDKSSTATDETSEASVVRDRKAKPYGSGSLMARPASISRGDGGVTQIERELPVRLALAAAAGEFDVRKHKNGYRLATVPRESWLDQLGFVKGDVVRSINGVPIESIHSVDHAYTTDNSGFRVEIERDGETKTLEFTMRRTPAVKRPIGPRPETASPELQAELEAETAKVKEVRPGVFALSARLRDILLDDTGHVATRTVRIVPRAKDGNIDGVKLFGIRSTSVAAKLGFKNGDVVHKVAGRPIHRPQDATEVFGGLRTADRTTVDLTRRDGTPAQFEYLIE